LDRFLQGGEISAEGEQQLCLAYQVRLDTKISRQSFMCQLSEHHQPTYPAC
jgi:hypothetical protein